MHRRAGHSQTVHRLLRVLSRHRAAQALMRPPPLKELPMLTAELPGAEQQ